MLNPNQAAKMLRNENAYTTLSSPEPTIHLKPEAAHAVADLIEYLYELYGAAARDIDHAIASGLKLCGICKLFKNGECRVNGVCAMGGWRGLCAENRGEDGCAHADSRAD